MKKDYDFLDFYYSLGGAIVPITRDKARRPLIKWKSETLTKEKLVKKFPISRFNYAFLIPEKLCIVDVEVHKGGLKQVDKLKAVGVNLLDTYHNLTGREGIHSFYKVKKNQKIPHGYSDNYDAIEILGPGKLVTIPPSIHITGKAYVKGSIKPLKKNIDPFPEKILKIFKYDKKEKVDVEPGKENHTGVLQAKIDELKNYLAYLDSTDFGTYTEWVKLLFASYDLTKGDIRGLQIFKEWSMQDPSYSSAGQKIKKLWDQVKKIKEDKEDPRNLITWKTLAYVAGKAGAKIKINLGRLIDEILYNSFTFVSTIENDGEYVRDIREHQDIFKNTPTEKIGTEKWIRLTEGVQARIMGFIFDESGITKNDFVIMRIKDRLERNRVSIFKAAWEEIEFRYGSNATGIKDLKVTKEIYFKLLKHKDPEHAKRVFPFFVKYLVSGIKANLVEYDDMHRSNSQTCLCISSDRQGLGKSTLARALTPCPEMIYYPNLKSISDMETKLAISRAAMCIIDDYQPTFQKELNNLNEILTQHKILVRPKYGRIEIQKTKRAYFALTTNYKKILNDFTGTRRWINIDLIGVDIEKFLKKAPRMHGEMLALARADFRHWFNTEEIDELEELNKPFSGTETLDNIILNHYDVNDTNVPIEVPAIEIMRRVNRAYGSGMIRDVRHLGSALSRLFPEAKNGRMVIDGRKLTTYNLIMVNPFQDGDVIINQGKVVV
jgi:hypothetical protein